MLRLLSAAMVLALPVSLAAQDHPDKTAPGGGAAPAGWTVRADRGDAKNAKIVPMGEGLHLTLGPAVILYRAETEGSGPFHTLATFTLTKPSEHPEGYGLFVGGRDLEGAAQQYLYFLVRQDGSYLIKRRDGEKTTDVSKGWVKHAAVKKPDGKGSSTNLLEIDNKRDTTRLVFQVNGEAVHRMPAKGMPLDGIVGIRANHNLDVHVEGFDVHR